MRGCFRALGRGARLGLVLCVGSGCGWAWPDGMVATCRAARRAFFFWVFLRLGRGVWEGFLSGTFLSRDRAPRLSDGRDGWQRLRGAVCDAVSLPISFESAPRGTCKGVFLVKNFGLGYCSILFVFDKYCLTMN
jgi:hypothetical protein